MIKCKVTWKAFIGGMCIWESTWRLLDIIVGTGQDPTFITNQNIAIPFHMIGFIVGLTALISARAVEKRFLKFLRGYIVDNKLCEYSNDKKE